MSLSIIMGSVLPYTLTMALLLFVPMDKLCPLNMLHFTFAPLFLPNEANCCFADHFTTINVQEMATNFCLRLSAQKSLRHPILIFNKPFL